MARPRSIGLVLALLTLLVYLPVRQHEFVAYDDGEYVADNPIVKAGLTWSGLKWAFTSVHSCNWHPLTWISHMVDCDVFGLDPGAHHLVNAAWHSLNVALLFWWLFQMTGTVWRSAIVAALFAWHPLHVESVAWVAERKDLLSTAFGLLSLMAYTRWVQIRDRRSFWLAWLLLALSLMSKPMLVSLPFVFLLLDYWPIRRRGGAEPQGATATTEGTNAVWKRLALEKWPFFLLSALACVVTYLAQQAEAVKSLAQYPLSLRMGNAVLSYGRYLFKTLWPADLVIIYPFPQPLPGGQVAAALALLVSVSWLAWRWRKQWPYLCVGWLWFLGTLVPVIGLVQVGEQAMADRYSYFPLIGIFIATVWGVADWGTRIQFPHRLLPFAGVTILAACVVMTRLQLRHWRDGESLFGHAVAVMPRNVAARINLGFALERQGRRAEAEAQYQEALRLSPDSIEAHVTLGNFAADAGKTETALAHYETALRLNPGVVEAHNNLGTLLVTLGRVDEAMEHYQTSSRLSPRDSRPHYLMGKACLQRRQIAEAISHFREALKRDPDSVPALVVLARVLASGSNPQLRNGPEAVVLAGKANTLQGGEDAYVLDTLAMAHAEAGHFPEARQTIEKAIRLAEAADAREVVGELQTRLRLYQSGVAYHEPEHAPPSGTNSSN